MKNLAILFTVLFAAGVCLTCERDNDAAGYSGTWCLNIQNTEMTIIQSGTDVTFTIRNDLLENGTGTVYGDTMIMTASTASSEVFTGRLIFSADGKSFSGQFQIADTEGDIVMEGVLQGNKGVCSSYDIESKGIPQFIENDFTQLSKIEKISKFRSGFGHSYTDDFETCRSMKHYYNPFVNYRLNNTVEIYSPVDGTLVSVVSDGHGQSIGLNNKQIQIRSDEQPAFTIVLFHCDLISSAIETGKRVQAGDLLGYARLYYDDLNEYATSFDIAVSVNTPSGMRLIPYFSCMSDAGFNPYLTRGVSSRQDFVISPEERDADPLQCNGETFLHEGNLENWVTLN